MVARLALVLIILAFVLSVAAIVIYRYFDNQAERRHEKEMLREERDAELLTGDTDAIDLELEREKKK